MKNPLLKIAGLFMLLMLLMVGNAFAILDADATAAIASISTFVTDIIAAVWPLAGAIAVGSIGIGLFKKFTAKAS